MPDAREPLSPQAGDATGLGNAATVAPGTSGKFGWLPATFLPGHCDLRGLHGGHQRRQVVIIADRQPSWPGSV